MPGEGPVATAASVEEVLRSRAEELRYKRWLEQVTINAVDQALRFQSDESQRHQWVGGPQELQGCSSNSTSCSERPYSNGRTWKLERNSEERRIVAARIYSLLVQWKPDMSFEWRARVAGAVHVFESALYRVAKSKEEYMNSLMLDLQLRQILRQFEAGTGSRLFLPKSCEEETHGPLTKSVSFNSALMDGRRGPAAPSALVKMQDGGQCMDEESMLPRLGSIHEVELSERDSTDFVENMRNNEPSPSMHRSLRKEEADSSLWEAILSGNPKVMEENLSRHRQYASKRVIKRVMGMLFKRKREEETKIELQLRKAMQGSSSDELAVVLTRAEAEFREELKDLCHDARVVLHRLNEEQESDDTGRASEVRPERGNVEVCFGAQTQPGAVASPRHTAQSAQNRLRRSVTFCTHDSKQGSSQIPNEEDTSSAGDSSGEANQRMGDAATGYTSAYAQERSTEVMSAFGQGIATARNGQGGTPCRPLGSILGWLHLGRTATVDAPQTARSISSPSRREYIGDSRASASSPSHANMGSSVSPTPVETANRASFYSPPHGEITNRSSSYSPSRRETAEPDEFNPDHPVPSTLSRRDRVVVSLTSAVSSSPSAEDNRPQAPRNSLIALLHQDGDPENVSVINRRRMTLGIRSETVTLAEELGEEMIDGGMDPICCVCMVGKKGAAFIPCGHTFCRKCTRELRKGRGTCPLCNRKIQDVLKIY